MSKQQVHTKDRQRQFTAIYLKVFPRVARYVAARGGSLEEAREVFHDAFILVYEKCGGESKISDAAGYIYGTARHLWARQFRKAVGYVSIDSDLLTDPLTEPVLQASPVSLLAYLERAGRKCMELLKAAYYDKLDLSDLADRFGFSGSRSASSQKHKCLEKVRHQVRENGLVYEDFAR